MKKRKNTDEDMPSSQARIVPDFLPPPHKLIIPQVRKKVTILLDDESVRFFKEQAKKHGAKYQQMMRSVLTSYAHQYRTPSP